MASKAPPSRRKFAADWDQVDYLYHKLLYWLYDRGDRRQALPFASRLEELLKKSFPGEEPIRLQECRSLIAEAKDNLGEAIRQRKKEIDLIRRLHDLARDTPGWEFVRSRYDDEDLSDRLDLLAILHHDNGDLGKALETLRESKRYCEKHGTPFDGQELLEDYLREKETRGRRTRTA